MLREACSVAVGRSGDGVVIGRLGGVVTLTASLLAVGVQAQTAQPSAAAQRVPISTAALQPFPFLTWPADFQPQNPPVSQDDGHFYFWDGARLQDVSGRTFLVTLVQAGESGAFNEYSLKKSVHSQLADAGAVRIAAAKIPASVLRDMPEVDRMSLAPGMGDPYNDPVETWVIKRPHHLLWIQYSDNSAQASLAVVASPIPE